MICFETSMGNVFMNVALRHNKQRMSDHAAVAGREPLVVRRWSAAFGSSHIESLSAFFNSLRAAFALGVA